MLIYKEKTKKLKKAKKRQKALDFFILKCYNVLGFLENRKLNNKSGCGAVGSALPWGGRGRKFKSCHSDHIECS